MKKEVKYNLAVMKNGLPLKGLIPCYSVHFSSIFDQNS